MRTLLQGRTGTLAVIALALLLAAGGTATAAKLITGKDVKNSSLTGADIRNSSLTGSDVKDRSLSPKDFSGSVQGPAGPQGAPGPTGAPGAKGDPGTAGLEVVRQTFTDVFIVNSGGQRGLSEVKTVSCPAGKKAIGGGHDLSAEADQGLARAIELSASEPNADGTGWSVQLFNNAGFDISVDVQVSAVCATVG
jgi:hypothetical protein